MTTALGQLAAKAVESKEGHNCPSVGHICEHTDKNVWGKASHDRHSCVPFGSDAGSSASQFVQFTTNSNSQSGTGLDNTKQLTG